MPAADKHSKTEKPTPKRKREARQNGQVAKSPDLTGWAAVLVAVYLLPWYVNGAKGRLLSLMSSVAEVTRSPSAPAALRVLESGLRDVLTTVAPLGVIFVLLALAGNVAQTGPAVSLKAARPKLSRLNPAAGLKRLFSPSSLVTLAKQLLKLVALSGVAFEAIRSLLHELAGAAPVSLLPVLDATASSVLRFVRIVALMGLVIGFGDYLYQRHSVQQSLKMTKDEVKEEAKQAEGDPHVKGMLKKRMYQIARSKMISGVRKADVVVTNPTHYAVALQYDRARASAPRVVAKGSDRLALRIREEAATCSVPVVEDPPLARYLFAVCDVEAQVPPEIYLAVAKLLAFVYALPEVVRSLGTHHHPPSTVPAEPAALAGFGEVRRARASAILAGVAANGGER